MKHLTAVILLIYSSLVFSSTKVTLPNAEDGGSFDGFKTILQYILNFMTGPYALFMVILFFVAFVLVWMLKPNGGFLSELMKWGSGILMLIFGIGTIVSWYNAA